MPLFEQVTKGDITMDPPTAVVKFRVAGSPPTHTGDFFSWVANQALTNGEISAVFSHPRGVIFLQDIQIHENHYARHYEVTAPYGRLEKVVGAYQLTVDQAVGQVRHYAGRRIAVFANSADDEVDNGGLIGTDGEEVTGVEYPVAHDRLTVFFRHPAGQLNRAYLNTIGKLRGVPNGDTFLGYAPGEVLYLGGPKTETDTEATASYTFDISYNATGLTIGGIAGVSKYGWDVFNPTYRKTADNNHGVKQLQCLETIRIREWLPYVGNFGWGG